MSWLNANEYVVMETTVRDRVEELRATIDPPVARAEAREEPRREVRACPFRPRHLAASLPG